MRVLIVKTSSMGDVLHTLPALTDAQRAIPGIQFDWVVEEGFAQIPSWHSTVDRVIPVAIRRWRKAWFSAPIKAERKAFHDAVRLQQYDAIIDAQGLVKSAALVTRLARGIKHGMDWSTAREPLASLFYNRKHHIASSSMLLNVRGNCLRKVWGIPNRSRRVIMLSRSISCTILMLMPVNMRYFYTRQPAMINTGRKPTGES